MADERLDELSSALEREGLTGAFSLVPPSDRAYFEDWISSAASDEQRRTRIEAVVRSLRR